MTRRPQRHGCLLLWRQWPAVRLSEREGLLHLVPGFFEGKGHPARPDVLIPIGANVTYKPGIRMVKFQTDVKTHIADQGGKLRWIKTEEVARDCSGRTGPQIDDIRRVLCELYLRRADRKNAPLRSSGRDRLN